MSHWYIRKTEWQGGFNWKTSSNLMVLAAAAAAADDFSSGEIRFDERYFFRCPPPTLFPTPLNGSPSTPATQQPPPTDVLFSIFFFLFYPRCIYTHCVCVCVNERSNFTKYYIFTHFCVDRWIRRIIGSFKDSA